MGYVEMLVPIPMAVPGIKLGLSNVIVLLALYVMGAKGAFGISIVRVFVSALLFRGMLGLWYSTAAVSYTHLHKRLSQRIKAQVS